MATYKDADELLAEAHKAANIIADLVEILDDLQNDLDDEQDDARSKAERFLSTAKIASSL